MQKSLGLIETQGLLGGITAADAAVKSANVELIGYELTKGGGWTTVKIQGDVGAVKAAVDAAKIAAGKVCRVVSTKVIARPARALDSLVWTDDTVGHEPPEPPAPPEPPVPPEPAPSPDEPKEDAAPPVEEAPAPEAPAGEPAEAETPAEEALAGPETPAETEPDPLEEAPAGPETPSEEEPAEGEPSAEAGPEEPVEEAPATPEVPAGEPEADRAPAPVKPRQQAKKGPAKRGQGGKRKQ